MTRRVLLGVLLLSVLGPAAWGQTVTEYNKAGIEHYNAKEWDAAIELFLKGYELEPDNATLRRNLCNAYCAAAADLATSQDFAGAAQFVELAISVDPENASAYMQLASYYLQLGHVSDAIFRLEEAVELAPDDASAHDLLGDAYYRDNDLPSALAEWELVGQLDPTRQELQAKLEKAHRENLVEGAFRRSGSRHFQASYPPGTPVAELNTVLMILERAYRDMGRRFDAYPTDPVHVIIYSVKEFGEATAAGEHVGALYDGKIRVPRHDQGGQPLLTEELERRLNHEYVHVLVRARVGDKVPWWLNEGLAETFSKDAKSIEWKLLLEAFRKGSLLDLAELEQTQLEKQDPETLRLAYGQAHATVALLWNRFGSKWLNAMLSDLAEGLEPEEALKASCHRSYELLEKEVVAAIRRGSL